MLIILYFRLFKRKIHSGLRTKTNIFMATAKFSDSELQEFKTLILGKLSEAQIDLDLLKGTLSHSDDHGTNDTNYDLRLI